MGLDFSKDSMRDSQIQKALKAANAKEKKILKILLLGPGDSGKTTIFKQLVLNKGPSQTQFKEQYVALAKPALLEHIVLGMKGLLKGTEDFECQITDENLKAASTLVSETEIHTANINELSDDLAHAIINLWKSKEVQSVVGRCTQIGTYRVFENFPALMDKLQSYPAWGGKNWTPDADDVMLVRQSTTGIKEQTFAEQNAEFKVIDLGGQRAERKKWIYMFDGVTGVIFVCSIADYDQNTFEADTQNRLEDTIATFKSLLENEVFQKCAFIVFFNKMDLFKTKYFHDRVPINFSGLFPDAPEAPDHETPEALETAQRWFLNKLKSSIDPDKKRTFSYYFTTALDKHQMTVVFDECARHVLELHLSRAGFIVI